MFRLLSDEISLLEIVHFSNWGEASSHDISLELLEKYKDSIWWDRQSCRILPISNKGLIKLYDYIDFDKYLQQDDSRIDKMSLSAAEIILELILKQYDNNDINFRNKDVVAIISRYTSSIIWNLLIEFKVPSNILYRSQCDELLKSDLFKNEFRNGIIRNHKKITLDMINKNTEIIFYLLNKNIKISFIEQLEIIEKNIKNSSILHALIKRKDTDEIILKFLFDLYPDLFPNLYFNWGGTRKILKHFPNEYEYSGSVETYGFNQYINNPFQNFEKGMFDNFMKGDFSDGNHVIY